MPWGLKKGFQTSHTGGARAAQYRILYFKHYFSINKLM